MMSVYNKSIRSPPQQPVINPEFVKKWISKKVHQANERSRSGNRPRLHPAIEAWKTTIETDPQTNMYFVQMFQEISATGTDLVIEHVTDYNMLMRIIDIIISEAPPFDRNRTDMLAAAVPFGLLLYSLSNTVAGQKAFLDHKVNYHLNNVLNVWHDYLCTIDSATVVNTEDGWISPLAIKQMETSDGKPFNKMYVCDQSLPRWGFRSWDHFFTRALVTNPLNPTDPDTNARPLDIDPTHVSSACESAVLRIASNVQMEDEFWLKDAQPYSLNHMLAHDPTYVPHFVGGTVYQAFLGPLDYHRWHSPVSGTIEKIAVLPGSYFAGIIGDADANSPIRGVLMESQPFLTTVATRVVFYINATIPEIGIVAFMPIGMAEISTCQVTVKEGQVVHKGEQLGLFRYGGSSSCLIFNNNTDLTFLNGIVDNNGHYVESHPVKINTGIAMAKKRGYTRDAA